MLPQKTKSQNRLQLRIYREGSSADIATCDIEYLHDFCLVWSFEIFKRIGSDTFTLPQLKIIQEVITMVVFAGFSVWYMKQPLKLDYLWASFCLLGAVFLFFVALKADELFA